MDLVLLLIGLYSLHKNNISMCLVVYFILATSFLNTKFTYLGGWDSLILSPNVIYVAIFLLLVLIFTLGKKQQKPMDAYGIQIKQRIFFLISFLIVSGIYDLLNGVSIYEIAKFIFQWLPLLIVLIASKIEEAEFNATLRTISTLAIGICSIYVLQKLVGVHFLFSASSQCNGPELAIANSPLLPSFANLALYLEIINYFSHSKKRRLYSIAVILTSVLLARSFSAFGTMAVASIFLLFLNTKNFMRKVFMATGAVLILGLSLAVSDEALTRFLPKIQEAANAFTNIDHAYMNMDSEQTFVFRMALFNERLDYIMQDPVRMARGIGLIHEKSFTQHRFKIGLGDSETGKIAQLDTADIAWSLFAIRFGFIGSIIWLLIIISILKGIWKYRRVNTLAYAVITYMIFEIIRGFASPVCFNAYFLIIPIMTYFQLRNKFLDQYANTKPNQDYRNIYAAQPLEIKDIKSAKES